jgi:putative phosphoribosyl transferase
MSEMPQISSASGNKTFYFNSRMQAGQLLADKLEKYKNEITTVLALSDGSLLVGAEIAKALHSSIAMLLTKDVYLPDGRTIVGVINETGGYVYNNYFSASEIEEFELEYRNNIEQAKMQALHEIHVALGKGGIITPQYFRNHVVIVVADASFNGMAFDMAFDYLKTIKYKKLVMVAPIVSVKAIDKMHVIADELQCLSVTASDIFDADHYFANNTMPNQSEIAKIISDTILNWKNPNPAESTGSRTIRRNIY